MAAVKMARFHVRQTSAFSLTASLLLLTTPSFVSPFTVPISTRSFRSSRSSPFALHQTSGFDEEIKSMRVKELKEELTKLGVRIDDVFEKDQLVERLIDARNKGLKPMDSTPQSNSKKPANKNIISAPIMLTALDQGRVASSNMNGGIEITGDGQKFATIELDVYGSDGNKRSMYMLLDTACSGVVVRPTALDKYKLKSFQTPVTMTAAGGVAGNTGMTQLERFVIAGDENKNSFGPLPAAVQDIGTLPSPLEGIIGLSFLNLFSCVDFDFRKGRLELYRNGAMPEELTGGIKVVSEADMNLLPLGVYSADMWLGTRGPVRMLVDTGAACTLLNWKGVEDLGIAADQRDSFLKRLPSPMGTMGADNVAMELTHRLYVSSTISLETPGSQADRTGLSMKGEGKRLGIDIGNIAILDQMPGVGGILGIDALLRSASVRMYLQGSQKKIQILQ